MAVTEANIMANVLRGLVATMVESLVDRPEEADVEARWKESCLVLSVAVAKGDLGKVIGKQGRTARSMRTILGGAARKHGVVCELAILNGGVDGAEASDARA